MAKLEKSLNNSIAHARKFSTRCVDNFCGMFAGIFSFYILGIFLILPFLHS